MLFVKALEEPVVITVVGQDIPNLKKGAFRDAQTIYYGSPYLKKAFYTPNLSDRIFQCKANGSIIEFNSYQDAQDAKSGKRDYLFANEADGIPFEIYWHLHIRTKKQRYIDYNPTVKFWVHEKFIDQPGVVRFISDYRDNPFLDDEQKKEIEAIEDDEMWKVYARGATGKLKGMIYPEWEIVDEFPSDKVDEVIWGIDYGYTVDPTAIVKIGIIKPRTLFVEEIAYSPGISEQNIKLFMENAGWDNDADLYSEHDKEKVGQLRRLGMSVRMAIKGEGSEKNGILKVKEFKVYYTRRSIHLHAERMSYRWEYVGDIPTNKPEKSENHLLDAIRYAVYTHFYGD